MKVTVIERKTVDKIKVAAYCRVSTDHDDQVESFKTQDNYYHELINNNPDWEYAGIFSDYGKSGTTVKKREGFLKMIRQAELGNIDMIIVKSISRFARNTVESLEMIRKLQSLRVAVFFEKENINTLSNSGQLFLSLLSTLAESESRSISTNEKWTIHKRMESGLYNISNPPYGYDKDKNGLIINQSEAPIVRLIFEKYLAGKGCRVIARELTELGYLTRTGKNKWDSSVVHRIISNPVYRGDLLLHKTITLPLPYRVVKNFGEENQYLYENDHTPIITREEAERVEMLKEIRSSERNVKDNYTHKRIEYIFTGKLYCPICNKTLKRSKRTVGDRVKVDWINQSNRHKCPRIKEKYLIDVLTKIIYRLSVNNFEVLRFFKRGILEFGKYSFKDQIYELENQLSDKYEQIYDISNKDTSIYNSAFYISEKQKVEEEIREIKNRIDLILYESKLGEYIKNTEAMKQIIANSKFLKNEFDETKIKLLIDKININSKKNIEVIFVNGLKIRYGDLTYGS